MALTRSHNVFGIGGINTYVWTTACELSRRGFEVHVISGCGEVDTLDEYWKERFDGQTHVLKKSNFSSQQEEFIQWAIRGSQLINDLKPDIIHFNGMIPFMLTSTPSIVTCHGLMNQPQEILRMLYDSLSYKRFVNSVIAVSKKVKRELLKYLKMKDEKVNVIPNGFDISAFHSLPIELRENAIVSGWGPIKNPEASLKVFHNLRKRGIQCKLYVAGVDRNQALSSMPELAHLAQDKDIVFTGRLTRHKMIEICQRVKCGLIPSLYESFSYVVLEFLASGTPVVASQTIPEDILQNGSAGFKAAPRDFSAMSDYVFDLLTDDELWDRMNRNALLHVRRFSIHNVVDALVDVYQSVASQNLNSSGLFR